MRGAFAMNEDPQIAIFAQQSSGCASMIEMNVGEQDGFEIRDGESSSRQLRAQGFQSGCRAGIENRVMPPGFKNNSTNRVRAPHPVKIKYRRGIHDMEWYESIAAGTNCEWLADVRGVCRIQRSVARIYLTA